MKIISYNVNGIRAAIRKGFLQWLAQESPDMICLQEVKSSLDQINVADFTTLGYHVYWMEATSRKGYSGGGDPDQAPSGTGGLPGCDMDLYDREGRMIRADFKDFSLMSVYMPSGTMGDERQQFKMQWLSDFYQYISYLKQQIPRFNH